MDKEKPLISVIIPVYKVEKYLDKCVESVVNQLYNRIEIILVDDGSPDNCPEMCDEWAKKDSRIRVIHKKNGGLSSARNAALDVMEGEYLTFVDSDDYIAENMISLMYSRMTEDNSDLAICNYRAFGDKDESEYDFYNSMPVKDEVLTSHEVLKKLVEYEHWHYVISCCKLYKSLLFDNFRYPEGRLHEDVFTAHHIFSKCEKISCVHDALYFYRQNDESITHNYSLKSLDIIDAYLDRLDFFLKRNMLYESALTADTVIEKIMQANDNLDLTMSENKEAVKHYKREYDKRFKKLKNNRYGNYKHRLLFRVGIDAVKAKEKIKK